MTRRARARAGDRGIAFSAGVPRGVGRDHSAGHRGGAGVRGRRIASMSVEQYEALVRSASAARPSPKRWPRYGPKAWNRAWTPSNSSRRSPSASSTKMKASSDYGPATRTEPATAPDAGRDPYRDPDTGVLRNLLGITDPAPLEQADADFGTTPGAAESSRPTRATTKYDHSDCRATATDDQPLS